MSSLQELKIKWLIVHILDPSNPIFSQMAIPLSQWPELENYFATHIFNSLQDSAAKAANFMEVSETGKVCRDLLKAEREGDFVKGSINLAKRLLGSIAKDKRISRGDFAVCIFHPADDPDASMLALMKIDPSQVYKHELQKRNGKSYVTFSVVTDVMPTTRERLQKCAFVQSLEKKPKPKFEIMVLDRQVRQLVGTPVAQFFVRDFLEAYLALDDKDRTRLLYRGLITAKKILSQKEMLSASEQDYLDRAINEAVLKKEINLETWINESPLSDDNKKSIKGIVFEVLPDREFAIDSSYAREKLIPWDRFLGDFDLRVEIPSMYLNQVIRVLDPVPGNPNKKQIIIETVKWEKMP